jgi:hypothetical protein
MDALTAIQTRPFYIALSILMGFIAVVGFWPGYFGPLFDGTLVKLLRVHIHAVLFTGWLLLFFVQAALPAFGKVAWHMRLGRFGIGYGMLLIPIGLYNAIARAVARSSGFYREFLDMLFFAVFFLAAIAYRRKPQLHKRLMIVATAMLLVAAASRMWFLPGVSGSTARLVIIFSILALPVVLAMGHDHLKAQRIHPVYIAGVFAFVVRVFSPAYLAESSVWLSIERPILSLFSAE